MGSQPPSGPRSTDLAAWPLVAVIGALVAVNVISNQVVPGAGYVPFALVVAGGLSWFAVAIDGRTAGELGWTDPRRPTVVRWGAGVIGAVVVVYVAAAAFGPTRPLFEDARVVELDGAEIAYQGLVRVPFGTVALEEVAFRGVLLAMLLARSTAWRAVAVTSLLFGLWHVLPAQGVSDLNPVFDEHLGGAAGAALGVAGAVIGTALAGVVFCWLRLRTASLLPPMLLHWATNGLGYLMAWLVLR